MSRVFNILEMGSFYGFAIIGLIATYRFLDPSGVWSVILAVSFGLCGIKLAFGLFTAIRISNAMSNHPPRFPVAPQRSIENQSPRGS